MDYKIIQTIDKSFKNSHERIKLEGISMGDAEFQYLLTKATITIVFLDIGGNNLTSLSIFNMRALKWNNLTYLWLIKNKIGDRGCKYLSRLPLEKLRKIYLTNQISSFGVSYLSCSEWRSLQIISFWDNSLMIDAVKAISKSLWNKNLKRIDLYENKVGKDELYKLILCDISVTQIDIRYNSIDKRDKVTLQFVLTSRFSRLSLLQI